MVEGIVGELKRRPQRRGPLVPFVVRPGRQSAANDNVPAPGSRGALRRRRRVVQLLVLSVAIAAAFAVGACGRRGAPELPASAAAEPRVPLYATEPQGEQVPNRKFVLDPMLQ